MEQEFNIELPADVLDGIYSNMALVSQSPEEFVLDFVRLIPGRQSGKVHSRIIMNPSNVKRLARLLQHHVYAYEQNHGAIKLPEEELGNAEPIPAGEA